MPHIDNMGHLGGLLSGVLVGAVLGKRLDPSSESVAYRRLAWGILILLLLLGIYGTMRFQARLLHGG
jgi:F0F1-type ATP synthase assembly protein I